MTSLSNELLAAAQNVGFGIPYPGGALVAM
jgi:hypothetical protein